MNSRVGVFVTKGNKSSGPARPCSKCLFSQPFQASEENIPTNSPTRTLGEGRSTTLLPPPEKSWVFHIDGSMEKRGFGGRVLLIGLEKEEWQARKAAKQ